MDLFKKISRWQENIEKKPPHYIMVGILFVFFTSAVFGMIVGNQTKKPDTQVQILKEQIETMEAQRMDKLINQVKLSAK